MSELLASLRLKGISGGGNGAVITVAYGAEFYNQTLVATNGTDTVSVLASSSGTADITVPSEGSWVISCTIGADTYTSDPVLVELSYEATITAIPNGKTVLPTDDIETWLECAGITDKAYTTLAEVLADTDTYTTLLGDSNACDYMARSTTWADMTSQTGEVPTMTSNTTPSGVVSAGTDYDTNGAYKAFDGDDSTYWRGNTPTAQGATATDYIQYKFASPTIARSVLIKNSVSGSAVNLTSVTVSASNDGSTFTPLYSDAITMPSTEKRVSFENDTAYSYYRVSLTVKNVSGSSMRLPHVSTLQFYEDAEIPSNADAMRLLGMYDYACDALLDDSTWCTAICGSTYFESVLDTKIPVLSANNQCIASSYYTGANYETYKMFDGNTSTIGVCNQSYTTLPLYVGYDFTENVHIHKVKYVNSHLTSSATFKLQGSDDNSTWNNVSDDINITSASQTLNSVVPNSVSYRYWRINYSSITASGGQYAPNACEVQFYGRHTAQTDIIHSAPSDTIYYLDNGSPVTLCTTDASGVGTVDWSTLPTGDITLYSSVAKQSSDLNADYGKTIRVSKYKTQAYLMPDTALYWWGYVSNNIQNSTSNTHDVSFESYYALADTVSGTNKYSLLVSKIAINASTVYIVWQGVAQYNNIYGGAYKRNSMITAPDFIADLEINSATMALATFSITSGQYIAVGSFIGAATNRRASKIYAIYY